jgi:hypothetical protein
MSRWQGDVVHLGGVACGEGGVMARLGRPMWLRDQEGSKYQIQVSHLLIIFSPVKREEFPDNIQAIDGSIYP